MSELSVSDLTQLIETDFGVSISPRLISTLFYERRLDRSIAPIRNGRRIIPKSYVPAIILELQRRGKVPQRAPGNAYTC